MSFPVTIDFDKLGLTDESNPLGDLPPIFTRSFCRSAGRMLGAYVADYLHYKTKRDVAAQRQFRNEDHDEKELADPVIPSLPDGFKHAFHGGERALLYGVVEDLLSTFGMNGKACLLRTVCEIHARDLKRYGVLGEMIKLFLTVTKSPFTDLIPEYVRAQEVGEGRQAPGECFPYCPKSIFKPLQRHKYSEFEQPNRVGGPRKRREKFKVCKVKGIKVSGKRKKLKVIGDSAAREPQTIDKRRLESTVGLTQNGRRRVRGKANTSDQELILWSVPTSRQAAGQ